MNEIAVLLLQTGNNTAPVFILALLCVIVLSSVGLAVLVGLTRRIQRIGDQGVTDRSPNDDDEP